MYNNIFQVKNFKSKIVVIVNINILLIILWYAVIKQITKGNTEKEIRAHS